MALTTLSLIKTALGIASSNEDTYLTAIQGGVEAALSRMTNRVFEQANYTEYYDGNNTNRLVLNQTPVYSIGSVSVDRSGRWGQNPDGFTADSLLESTDYYLIKDGPGQAYSESGILVRVEDVWLGFRARPMDLLTLDIVPGQGNIRVVYVGGYATIPNDLQMCVWEAIGALRQTKKFGYSGFIQSESLSASAYSLGPYGESILLRVGTVPQILATYTKPVI